MPYKANPCIKYLDHFLDGFYYIIEDVIGIGIYNHSGLYDFRVQSTLLKSLRVKVIVKVSVFSTQENGCQ